MDPLEAHLPLSREYGEAAPPASELDALQIDPDVDEAEWILVRVELGGGPVKFDLTLPSDLLDQIDQRAQTDGSTRAGILASAARTFLRLSMNGGDR